MEALVVVTFQRAVDPHARLLYADYLCQGNSIYHPFFDAVMNIFDGNQQPSQLSAYQLPVPQRN